MPTKPLVQPSEWASNSTYSVGPKATQNTKIDEAGAAPDGHIPGLNFPTTSNEFNSWCNKVSNLARWLFVGSTGKDLDAHVVESRAVTGLVSAAALDVGGTMSTLVSLIVSENASGVTALFKSVNNDSVAIVSTHADGLFHKSLLISANANLAGVPAPTSSHVAHMTQTPASSGEGPGGLLCETDSGVFDTAGQPLAAVSGRNISGVSGHFLGTSAALAALVARNQGSGTSARFGYGGSESTKINHGGLALDAKGGPGQDSFSLAGGTGATLYGGNAESGASNKAGGLGALIQGGLQGTGLGGVGARIVAGAGDDHALQLRFHTEPGATAFLLHGRTGDNLGGGAHFECEGAARGLRIETQAGIGLALIKSEAAGQVNEHIFMTPMEKDPTGTISSGSTWLRHANMVDIGEGTSETTYFKMRMGSIKRAFITSAQGGTCYLRAENASFVDNQFNGTTDVSIAAAKFHTNDIPENPIKVLVTIHAQILHNGTPQFRTNTLDLVFTDDTEGAVKDDRQFSTIESGLYQSVTYSFTYTLALGGQRAFSLGIRKKDSGTPDTSSVRIRQAVMEIHELRAP